MKVYKYGNINDMPRGWVNGKGQPKWHRVAYDMWKSMWSRVHNNINYFGKTIQPKYKYLSGYIEDFQKLENFDLFKENPYGWSIDKDIKGGTYIGYYFEYLSLVSRGDNSKDVINRFGNSYLHTDVAKKKSAQSRKKPIIGISLNSIILLKSVNDAYSKGFNAKAIPSICKGTSRSRTHGGYKWLYVNYKHNKLFRKV